MKTSKKTKGLIGAGAALLIAAAAWMLFKKKATAMFSDKERRYSDTFKDRTQPPKNSGDISST